jgi:3-hydroxyacyl-[acyl-carrier-protein] dehydratase
VAKNTNSMQLKNDFYSVTKTQQTDNGVNFTVHLNADHFIYAAHFPGNPITPGVCITQIVKELTEELLQKPLFLKVVKNIKFTQVINPLQYPEVIFAISTSKEDETGYKVSVNVECGSEIFAKMSLLFVKN